MNSFKLIDDDSFLAETVIELSTSEIIGVDAERASGFRYGQDAYLVQLIANETAYLIDPHALSPRALANLAEVLNQKEWILHSATQDLPCLNQLGMYPQKLFDTEVAAKLIGFEKFGLAALVQETQGIELKKEHSAADWSMRPLTPEMLEYAAQDVYFLKELREQLLTKLKELERESFASEEFQHLQKFKAKQVGPNPWRRCSGIHALTKPLQLARVREMWLVRDEYARANDIAPGRVISDRSISYAAGKEYGSLAEMKKDKQFHGRLLPKLYPKIHEAYKNASNTEMPPIREHSTDTIPHHKNWQKLKPEVDARYKEVKEMLLEKATETGIPVENLMSPALIREALWREVENQKLESFFRENGAREWQLGFILPVFSNLS